MSGKIIASWSGGKDSCLACWRQMQAGDNGEFHTLIIDGPCFSSPIELTETQVIFKKGFWDHWFLDIKSIGKGAKQ